MSASEGPISGVSRLAGLSVMQHRVSRFVLMSHVAVRVPMPHDSIR